MMSATIGPDALVRDVARVDAGRVEEHRAGQVDDGAVARRGVVVAVGLGLQQRLQFLGVLRRHLAGLTTSTNGVAPTTEIGVMSLIASNGIFLNTLGFTTWLFDTTPIVWPSAGALTMALRAGDAAGARQVLDHDRLAAQRLGRATARRLA